MPNLPPAPNESLRNNRRNSADPMGGSAPVGRIEGSNPTNRFNASGSKMPQPPAAVKPGKPAIPVLPFDMTGKPGGINLPEADEAKSK